MFRRTRRIETQESEKCCVRRDETGSGAHATRTRDAHTATTAPRARARKLLTSKLCARELFCLLLEAARAHLASTPEL